MRKYATLLVLIFYAHFLSAQGTVSGVVKSSEGNLPLPGISIMVKGKAAGTSTDNSGRFSIAAANGDILVFSGVGFRQREAVVSGNSMEIFMETETAENLQEVVITGYTSQTRRQFTGSVSRVSGEDVNLQPMSSMEQLLQGRSPGVFIQSQSGQPGSAASVTIRGKGSVLGGTQPLYIVDGIQVTASDFQGINPADIETYNILKDAVSTSQYGSRGANGVIVVTTRRGKNARTVLNYDFQYGISSLPENKLRLLNSAEKLDYEINYDRPDGMNPFGWSDEEVDSLSKIDAGWEDAVFRTAKTQQHILSATGGNDKTRFFISGSYFSQDGLLRTTDLDRYTGRLNLDHTAGNFRVGISSTFGYSIFSGTDENDNVISTPLNAFRWTLPYTTPYLPDGSFNRDDPGFNPNPLPDLFLNKNSNKQIKAVAGINLEYRFPFLRGLSARTLWGIDFTDNQNENYTDINTMANDVVPGRSGAFNTNTLRRTRRTGTTSLNYEGRSGNHNYGVGVFIETVQRKTTSSGFTGFGLIGPIKNAAGITPGTPTNNFIPTVTGRQTEDALISYFAIANYDYRNKYFINLTGRRDGSSRLAPGKKFVNYGGIGLGWQLSSEDFMSDQQLFSNLKLKVSYGSAGNADIGDDYEALELFGPVSYNGVGGLNLINLKKNALSWETRRTANAGLEFGMFNSRLNGSVEFYNATTHGLFLNRLLSSTTGAGSIVTNLGKLRNRGVEIALNYDVVRNRNFNVNIFANWTTNRSEVLALDGNNEIINGILINRVGERANSFYLVRFAGVDAADGEAEYYKADGKTKTKVYDPNDAVLTGAIDPKGFGGFGTNVNFKGIELSALFTYQYGGMVFNNARADVENPQYWFSSLSANMLNEWRAPGDVTNVPSAFSDFQYATTRFLEKSDYVRLRNVMLSYTLPNAITSRLNVSSLRVFVQGQNLFTWHDFLGYDPEVPSGILTGAQYPALKAVTFGVSLGL